LTRRDDVTEDAAMTTGSLARGVPIFALSSLVLAACSGGAPGEATSADDQAEVANGATLTMNQIHDVGSLTARKNDKLSYTGKPRYIGARIKGTKGTLLSASNEIDKEEFPVIVVADDQLHVLAHVEGATISGAPGTSSAFLEFPLPHDGTYWLLYSEAHRLGNALNTFFSVTSGAHASCHGDDDCHSRHCVAHACAESHPTDTCLEDADCTSNKCATDDLRCQFLSLGDACSNSSDCTTDLCEKNMCACVASGQPASEPQQCCSSTLEGDSPPRCL
jgi:hypothetical protein